VVKNTAKSLFDTNISLRGVRLAWKRGFLHVPVIRKTVLTLEGWKKSNEPTTKATFDNNSSKLGLEAGLSRKFSSYVYCRGNLETLDSESLPVILALFLTVGKPTTVRQFGIREPDIEMARFTKDPISTQG
jgi:hypothetical protein